jgi:hypothetical protein
MTHNSESPSAAASTAGIAKPKERVEWTTDQHKELYNARETFRKWLDDQKAGGEGDIMKQTKKVKEFREALANGLLDLPAFAGPGGQTSGDKEKDSKFRKVRFSSFPDATHSLTCNYSSPLSTTSRTTLTTVTKRPIQVNQPRR